jgi:PAS domain S-box-containing protein
VYINSAFTALTGYEPADILGQSCRILQGSNVQQGGRVIIKRAINDGTAGQAEFINYRKDGSMFWNSVKVMPLVTSCPNVRYVLGFQVDMTAVVSPELALQYALQREKVKHTYELHQERLATIGSMAAATAHEVNNPIAGIMMNLEFIKGLEDIEEVKEVTEESLAELKRVSRLIKAMLGFSRKADNKPVDRVCSAQCVIEEALLIAQPFIKTGGVQFTQDTRGLNLARYTISADADEVKQVVFNLISNAVQAMLDVPLSERFLTLDYFITDTGLGIPPAVRSKIFDPFFTTKPEGEGTGLGLSISAKLVQDFGGILTLDESYITGARFLLYLPFQLDRSAPMDSDSAVQNKSQVYSALVSHALVGGG